MVKDSMNKTLSLLCLSFFLTACGSGSGSGGSDSGSFRLDITGVEKYAVHVSWSAQKEEQGYAIYVNNNRQGGTELTHTTVGGLKPGQRVCIYVRAIEPDPIIGFVGLGSQSKTDCTTTLENRPPLPPSGFIVTQPEEGSILVNWDVPDDDSWIYSYLVYRDDILVGTVYSPQYTDTDTVVGIRNCYQVQAVDNDGASSPRSASTCETEIDTTPPTVPGLPDVNAQAGNGHQVELAWTESVDRFGTTGYRVFRDQIQIADIASPGYFDDQTIVNTEYCYTIVAYDAAGNESVSSESTCILAGWRRLLVEEGLGYSGGEMAVDIHGRVHFAFDSTRYIPEDLYYDNKLRYVVLHVDDSWNASVISDGPGNLAGPAITSDAFGVQHLVYGPSYQNDESGAWSSPVSMSSVDFTGIHDVVVDDQGFAHIIYRSAYGSFDNMSSLVYASNRSGQWEFEVIGQDTNFTMEAAIAIGINDRVHVAYYNDESKVLHHAMRDSGTWTVEPILENVDLVGRIDAAVDSNGSMHVVSYDATDSNLLYAVNDTGSWSVETIHDSGDVGYESAIAIDSNGVVHVLYSDNTNLHVEGNYDSMLRYATRQNNTWTNQIRGTITWPSISYSIRDGVRQYKTSPIGLQVDAVGYIHIMYENNNHLVYSTNRPKL
ncbi:MAG: hypothetical protein LJE92_00420 [Gammaproteobacteria bacterium]|jgi:hypothetical protein|nr:hypothetical protein [Gammaproteobacteria bacterium]